jgi:hypothetical protein
VLHVGPYLRELIDFSVGFRGMNAATLGRLNNLVGTTLGNIDPLAGPNRPP